MRRRIYNKQASTSYPLHAERKNKYVEVTTRWVYTVSN